MNNILDNKKFRALMAYLNPIGSIGINVDMYYDEIEYFGLNWTTENLNKLEILNIFQDSIYKLVSSLGKDLYNKTNKQDMVYWVDITINPKNRKIIITPKFYNYVEDKEVINFNWKEYDGYGLIDEYIDDLELDSINVAYNGYEGNFNSELKHKKTDKPLLYFRDEFYEMVGGVLDNGDWNEEGGGSGNIILKNNQDGDGRLFHTNIIRNIESGNPIIIDENYFK